MYFDLQVTLLNFKKKSMSSSCVDLWAYNQTLNLLCSRVSMFSRHTCIKWFSYLQNIRVYDLAIDSLNTKDAETVAVWSSWDFYLGGARGCYRDSSTAQQSTHLTLSVQNVRWRHGASNMADSCCFWCQRPDTLQVLLSSRRQTLFQ